MEITNLKTLIENHLACMDIESNPKHEYGLLVWELNGMKKALRMMGLKLEVNLNPYYYDDKKPSTYTLSLEE